MLSMSPQDKAKVCKVKILPRGAYNSLEKTDKDTDDFDALRRTRPGLKIELGNRVKIPPLPLTAFVTKTSYSSYSSLSFLYVN